jgi:hypothetical protein
VRKLLAALLVALALPATAQAAYTPKMSVQWAPSDVVTFRLYGAETDDASAKITIYVPRGVTANLAQSPGTRIGTGKAISLALDFGGAKVPLNAHIETADPAAHVQNQCDARLHRAVWILVLSAFGSEIRLPLYVDAAEGAEAAFASYKIQTCLAPPDVPEGTPGRSPLGSKLVDATLSLQVFTIPPGEHTFSAVFTPYVPRMGTPNAAGTVEVRGMLRAPHRLTLTATRTRWSGTLTQGGQPVAGAAVKLGARNRGVAVVRTNASGRYTWNVKLPRGGKLLAGERVNAVVLRADQDVTAQACAGTSIAPAGCVSGILGGFTAKTVATVRR